MSFLGQDLDRAVALLQAGELVAFPTETVYGLGADASNSEAVAKIFAAKGRPEDHPLIVHLPGVDALEAWARDIPDAAHRLAAAFWPGPLTLILKRHPRVPDAVTGGQDTVGLRVPDHRLALALLRAFDEANGNTGSGIAAPSANRYGRISPTRAAHVREELGERVSLILDGGPCAVGIESTIVDCSGDAPRILRPGAISAEALAQVLAATEEAFFTGQAAASAPRVSGSTAAHYAPRTPMRLVLAEELVAVLEAERQLTGRLGVLARRFMPPSDLLPEQVLWWNAPLEAPAYARALYATLRKFDAMSCRLLLVEAPPADEAWRAVADRLQRAACGSGSKET